MVNCIKMADDLTIGPTEEQPEEVEAYIEYTTIMDYVTAAAAAWQMVDEIDTAILNKTDERRVRRMKRQALRIMSVCLNDLYEELFDDNNDGGDSADD